jgi:2-methylcitrate dehydratase
MDRTTTHLADYAVATAFASLPPSAVHACKRRLVDSMACAIGALDEPLCQRARRFAARHTGRPDAAVWGSATRSSPDIAAFANGIAVRYLDHSDTFVAKSPGHPSDVIAGILAVADTTNASGAEVINAIVLAYDIYCGFLAAVAAHAKGIDQATAVVMAVAAGCGRLLGLSRDAIANAISLALAPNLHLSNVRLGELSDWKGCAGANGARAGVFAAFLAQDGFTGPSAVFDGPGGLWTILGDVDWRLDRSDVHRIEQSDIKTFPVCYHGLSAVEAAIGLRNQISPGSSFADSRSIEIDTYGLAISRMAGDPSRWAPKTRETADHSLPYVVSVALLDGELTSGSYAAARLHDAALLDLMAKVQVHETREFSAGYPDGAPARVTAVLASGQSVSAEISFPKGHKNNPVSDAELEAKFFTLAARGIDPATGRALLNDLWACDTLPVMSDLFRRLGD